MTDFLHSIYQIRDQCRGDRSEKGAYSSISPNLAFNTLLICHSIYILPKMSICIQFCSIDLYFHLYEVMEIDFHNTIKPIRRSLHFDRGLFQLHDLQNVSWWIWTGDKGCLLFLSTWSHLWYIRGYVSTHWNSLIYFLWNL
jgi:hypothetical protein